MTNWVAAVLFAAGVALLVKPRSLIDFWFGPRIFYAPKWDSLHPLLIARLRAAFERRREVVMAWPGYACGSLLMLLGAAGAIWHFTLAQLLAGCAAVSAPVLAIAFRRAGPRTSRRAAVLWPRKSINGPAAGVSFASSAVIAVTGCIVRSPDSIAVSVAAIVCAVSALWFSTAPAVLTGDDLPAERYVDELIRTVQVLSLNLLGALPGMTLLSSQAVPDWAKAVMFCAYFLNWLAFYRAYRLPSERERWEMVQ